MSLLSVARRRAAALADDGGFVLIEAVIAAFILILAAVAIFDAYDASTHATFRAQQSQVELSRAQQEMERIRALSYPEIALTKAPDTSPDPASPLNRVNASDEFNLNRSGTPNYAALVVNGGPKNGGGVLGPDGTIDPTPQLFQSGDVSGSIYRFIVWQSNNGCPQPTCSGQDIKRVVIVVQPDATAAGGPRPYVEIHSDFIDPDANSLSDVPTGGGTGSTQTFWLTDTRCDPNGPTQYQDITADHPLHNTLADDCSAGPGTGTERGAPDALLTTQPGGLQTPPFDDPFDYQSDWNSPMTKEGIQIAPEVQSAPPDPPNPPCRWMADGSPNPQVRFHVWLSDEILPTNQPFELSGPVSLFFFSRTLNPDEKFPGTICIWLFRRKADGTQTTLFGPGTTQTPSWTWSSVGNTADDNWPPDYGDPADEAPAERELIASTDLGAQKVTPNSRLGLAISVSSDTQEALELMYDHPLFPSRLEVDTTTPLTPPG